VRGEELDYPDEALFGISTENFNHKFHINFPGHHTCNSQTLLLPAHPILINHLIYVASCLHSMCLLKEICIEMNSSVPITLLLKFKPNCMKLVAAVGSLSCT